MEGSVLGTVLVFFETRFLFADVFDFCKV
jgi:hypothetical protein